MTSTTPGAVVRAVRAAGAVLVAWGLIAGFVPLPHDAFGCGSAFAGGLREGSTELVVGCADQRGDRQSLAIALLATGTAAALGASAARRDRAAPDRPPDLPRLDEDDRTG